VAPCPWNGGRTSSLAADPDSEVRGVRSRPRPCGQSVLTPEG
jgi:hypothetical protein